MNEFVVASAVLLTIAGCLAAMRIALGPSVLDRVVALDMLLAIIVSGLAVMAVIQGSTTIVSVLVVVALLGFISSISLVRFLDQDSSEW